MSLILLLTVFAILFYTTFFGMAIGLNHKEYFFEEVLLELIPKSLFLTWIAVFLSYSFNLPNLFWLFLVLTIIILFWRKPQVIVKLDLFSGIILLLMATIGFVFISDKYDWNFMDYDAVVSWNRWAKELFLNEYDPNNSAYPILFPALWSLIYKVQGHTDIWILPKLSLFVTPILLTLSGVAILRKNFIVGLCLIGSIGWIYFYKLSEVMMNGYMDGPVSGLILVSILALILALENQDENSGDGNKFIYISSFLFGIAAVTKQAGYLSLIFFIIWLVVLYFKRRIKRNILMKSLIISIVPVVLFMILFLPTKSHFIGNLETLKQLSEQRTGGDKVAASFNYLKTTTGSLLFYLLLTLSFLNVFFIKKTKSQLGLLLLLFACIGFYLYQDCCSYSARNGWWILALLVGSALCTALQFKSFQIPSRYRVKFNWLVFMAFLLSLSILISMNFSIDQLERITEKESKKLIPPGVDVLKHIPDLGDEGVIISKAFPMAHHKELFGKVGITFLHFEYIMSIDGSIPYDSCKIANRGKISHLKSHALEGVLLCMPKSLVHVNDAHYVKLVKNYPNFKFETIDSASGYKLVKPILLTENIDEIKSPDE